MRHQLRIPLLSKPADQRKALLRGLTTQLIREGRVTTTKARAKALRNEAERMISLAKDCLLYTSPSPRDLGKSRMPSSA